MACACCDCQEKECRSSISLEKFREILCLPAYSFWQLGQWRRDHPKTVIPINEGAAPCAQFVFERCHQECTIAGRDQICKAIEKADRAFLDYMRYPATPTALCAEFFFGTGDHCLNVTGQKPFRGGPLQLPHYKIRQLGKQTLTKLQTIPFVPATQLTDQNGDTLYDRATVTIAKPLMHGTTEVAADEIALFFVEEDRGNASCCRWEIRDLTVRETATEFVITMPAWVMVKPHVYDSYKMIDQDEEIHDPANLTIYPVQLDLYRRWVDTTQAVTVHRKPIACSCGRQVGDACYECETIDACLLSAEQGLIDVRLPSLGDCGCCPKCVERLCVRYVAGSCNEDELIANLAASYLPGDVCCTPTRIKYAQAEYVAVSEKGKLMTTLSAAEQSNPFGTKRGMVDAYRELRARGRKLRIGAL